MLYIFGDCELHEERREFYRSGQCIHLRPKVFQLLLYLLKNRSHLVTKVELFKQVWPEIQGEPNSSEIANVERAISDLRTALDAKGRAQPLIKAPRGQRGYRFIADVIVRPEEALPPIWNIPHRRNPNFTGRESLLEMLRSARQSGQPAALTQSLSGLGGVGKTQLAAEYAYRNATAYDVVWWVRAEDAATLITDYAHLARRLNLVEMGASEQTAVPAVRHWLERNGRWLLVFDNAGEPIALRSYLPNTTSGHVLITSRNVEWGDIAHMVIVPVFERFEAVTFVCHRTQRDDKMHAAALAEALGDLPLALAQAAAYIDVTGTTLAHYLALFHSQRQELWQEERPPLDYPRTAQTTWALAFERLQKESPASTQLLTLMAYLAPDEQPLSLLHDGVESLPQPLAASVANPFALNRAVAALRRYSLLERKGDTLAVHRLVQVVTRDRLTAAMRQFWIDTAMQLMLAALSRVQRDGHLLPIYARHALEVVGHINTLPPTPERTEQELALLLTLGPILMVTRGYGALEVQHIYERARKLCQPEQLRPELFPALFGLVAFYHLRAEHQHADTLGMQIFTLAQQTGEPEFLLEAHLIRGCTLWGLGECQRALIDLDTSYTFYKPQYHHTHTVRYGQDPAVVGHGYAAQVLWLLGRPEQAQQRLDTALTLAQGGKHLPDRALAHGIAAVLYCFRREADKAQKYATTALTLSAEYEFLHWKAHATVLQGWALATQGEKEGIAQIHRGVADWQRIGAQLGLPYYMALLAEIYGEAGQLKEGLAILADALHKVDTSGERWWEAELYRLKGEFLLKQAVSDEDQAETCFRQALDVARCQQATSLELRAAMSLSRLWQQQGKRDEARQLLAEVYGWFSEGRDTADLQEAQALLEALTG